MLLVAIGDNFNFWEKNKGKNFTVMPLPKPEIKSEKIMT
jgi:hypothetical protein|tara:strand:- start:256 stop:372 length:117 start_codon:yes stop_codon:yes gene_type:complete